MTVNVASVVAIGALALAFLCVAQVNQRQAQAWQWVAHTREVQGHLVRVTSLARAAESAQRGYMLSRRPDYLDELQASEASLYSAIDAVASLTRDNPRQQEAVRALRPAAATYIDMLRQRAANAPEGRVDEPPSRDDAAMRTLTSDVASMLTEEDRLLRQRELDASRARDAVVAMMAGMGLLSLFLVVVLRWVSHRDARQLALRAAELEAVFRAAPAGLGIVDSELRITQLNDALAQFFHQSKQGATGLRPSEILRDTTGSQMEAGYLDVLRQQAPRAGVELERVEPDGGRTEWLASFHPVPGPMERSAAIVAMVEITSLKRAQHELGNANRLLESRVAERTRQLVDANDDLQAFAHTVAHDLRAPLRNVEGFAMAVLEDDAERVSEAGRHYLQRIRAGVLRMDALITDLLAYSKMAREELKIEPVSLSQAIHQACRQLESMLQDRAVVIECPPDLPVVMANATLLVQVIANLVSNATKFVADGVAPHVAIEARREGAQVVLVVDDNGIGVAPEHRDRIFGVFERLHGQEAYPGTGIGLAIVRRAVTKMQGSVRVVDSLRGGARFEVQLPAADERAE